ncbi:Lipoprotein [Sulfitobacter noctilucicola]|uniref:Lipoprotein n=1 Tax=Sulfitobacter noctilucicola TaxID=1342301 RepID=A0A7W6Q553_9RHOB|nr:hypothetical protein [Sulfitobacter noctilucicola]KIN62101.1 Lipoprotein [Sulfitobacter noctilucicola]MBB4173380.1 hypothetical protein [Sulfitobacter noctilucicola]
MKRVFAILTALSVLGACAANTGGDSTAQEIAASAYRAGGQPSLTLFTMVNNRTGEGGHSALMVNGSQRVIFDPAGSFRDDRVVERADVLYGITPGWLQAYKSSHARVTFHVVSQEIPVTAAQAEQALRLVQGNGQVSGGFCANATSSILTRIDGLGGISTTFFPVKLMEQLEQRPGVRTTKLYEDDSGDLISAVRAAALAQANK